MRIIETRLCRKGYAFALFERIFIHPESPRYLIAHEAVHVDQQRKYGWRWYWRYIARIDARFDYELEAHRAAIRAGQPQHIAAIEFMSNYGFDIDYEQATLLLMN